MHKAWTLPGHFTGEFVAIVALIPFAGGLLAGLCKYIVFFYAMVPIFTFGAVGAILSGMAGAIWNGILVGWGLSKRMRIAILGKENGEEELSMSSSFNFKRRNNNREKKDFDLDRRDNYGER